MSDSFKKDSGSEFEYDISASTSNGTEDPAISREDINVKAYHLEDEEPSMDEKMPRRLSVFLKKSQDGRRSSILSNKSAVSHNYSVKDIYGDLGSEDVELQRKSTRVTIIDDLVKRTYDLEYNREIDLESASKSHYDHKISPESNVYIEKDGEEFRNIDPELITWDGPNDPENPRNWPSGKKMTMLVFVSFYALVAPMSSSIISPAMSKIAVEFHITSSVVESLCVSIQILAWAIGPLLIAPLSEVDKFGRKSVLDCCIWLSFAFNIGCAFSQTTAQLLVFRFIGGLFGCIPMNVCAGVISDLFDADARNVALASYSLAPVLGPCIAPLISGFIVDNLQWRWVLYVLCIFNGLVAILATLFFKETYSPKLLRIKAMKLRKETGNSKLHTIYEIADGETTSGKIYLTITRPLNLLFTHPMVMGLGSFMSFTYGFMYLMIVAFPTIFGEMYGFSKSITGLMYIPMGIGFALGVFFWTYAIGKVYNHLKAKNNGVPKPEFRLPCLFVASFLIPIGLLWFGWSVQKKLHWIMPGIGSGIFAFGLVCVFQTIQNYLIDMNTKYAASSVAAAALFRSLFGFSFPLFAGIMYAKLNYGVANTMCAAIGLVLGTPFPIICYLRGERIRAWADKRFEKSQFKRDQRNLERLRNKSQ